MVGAVKEFAGNVKELFTTYGEQPEVVVDVRETVLEPKAVRQALEKMSTRGTLDITGLQ